MTGTFDLTLEKTLSASPDVVWRCWSEPALLERWFAPAPVTTRVVSLDLRPGGAFATEMTLADGVVMPASEGCFLVVEPARRLVFTDALRSDWRPNAAPFMTAEITLTPEGSATRYVANVRHVDAEGRRRHEEMGFETGWGAALDQLDQLAAGL